jgi:hypothetical protein
MKATLLLKERHVFDPHSFVEMCVWQLPQSVRGSAHLFKYRLALVINDQCVLRYDNEPGKGDHRHLGTAEVPYVFLTPAQLIADFWSDVDHRRKK